MFARWSLFLPFHGWRMVYTVKAHYGGGTPAASFGFTRGFDNGFKPEWRRPIHASWTWNARLDRRISPHNRQWAVLRLRAPVAQRR